MYFIKQNYHVRINHLNQDTNQNFFITTYQINYLCNKIKKNKQNMQINRIKNTMNNLVPVHFYMMQTHSHNHKMNNNKILFYKTFN